MLPERKWLRRCDENQKIITKTLTACKQNSFQPDSRIKSNTDNN